MAVRGIWVLSEQDIDLGLAVAGMSWVTDGITRPETFVINYLADLAVHDLESARAVLKLPWVTDGVSGPEVDAMERLVDLAVHDPESARAVLLLPWVIDGITDSEVTAILANASLAAIAVIDSELTDVLRDYPWVSDGLYPLEDRGIRSIGEIAKHDLEFARAVVASAWVVDGVEYPEEWALQSLAEIAERDRDFANVLASYGDVTNGIENPEKYAIAAWIGLAKIAVVDRELADAVAAYPWVTDGIDDEFEGEVVIGLADASIRDLVGLARVMATYTWIADGIDFREARVIGVLSHVALYAREIGRAIAAWPWIEDGVDHREMLAVRDLVDITLYDPDLASAVTTYPWVVDGIEGLEGHAIAAWVGVANVARHNRAFADYLEAYPWVVDGIDSPHEAAAVQGLGEIGTVDIELARVVAGYPWVVDGIDSPHEGATVQALGDIAKSNLELADAVAAYPWVRDGISGREGRAVESLKGMRSDYSALAQLLEQPWFTDGIDDEEFGFIGVLDLALDITDLNYYSGLVETHYTRASSISLPLRGGVDVAVFRPIPFPDHDDTLNQIEHAVRFYEMLLGATFPSRTIDVLVIDGNHDDQGVPGFYFGSRIKVHMGTDGSSPPLRVLYHELAHFYLSEMGPVWLEEGGANFLTYLILERDGLTNLEHRKAILESHIASCRDEHGIQKIEDLSPGYRPEHNCHYILGEFFLLSVSEAVGEAVVTSALRDLYQLAKSEFSLVDSEQIYETFLANTPPGLEDDFRDVYGRIHGGPYAHPEK